MTRLTGNLALTALLGVAACSSSSSGASAPSNDAQAQAAIDSFWQTFHAGDLGHARDVQGAMIAAYEGDPDKSAELASDIGMLINWQMVQNMGNAPPQSFGDLAAEGQLAVQYLTDGMNLEPDNVKRIGFLEGTLYAQASFGPQADAGRRAAAAQAVVDRVMPTQPIFADLALADTMLGSALQDPDFARGLGYRWDEIARCMGVASIDTGSPDFSGWGSLRGDPGSAPGQALSVCWNQPKVPHLEEANFLYLGDTLVALGKIDTAKLAYQAASLGNDYTTWKQRPVVEQRLTEDLAARAALYQSGDPSKMPRIGGDAGCLNCHGS